MLCGVGFAPILPRVLPSAEPYRWTPRPVLYSPPVLPMYRIPFLLGVLVYLCACEPADEAGGDAAGPVESWSLVEDFRLGAVEGGTAESFGAFLALEATPDGNLMVADQQNSTIEIFDRSGVHVRSVGRRGSGPGEFLDLIGLELDGDGRLWAVDAGNRRFAIFDPAGVFLGFRPFSGFRSVPWPGRIDRQGRLHNLIVTFGDSGPRMSFVRSALEPDDGSSSAPTADTLPLPPYEVVQQEVSTADGRRRLVNVPFAPRPRWVMDAEGELWFGTSEQFTIHRIDYSGDTVAVVRGASTAVPLTDGERQHVLDVLRGPLGPDALVDPGWIPDHRPQFESLTVDDQNRLWVGVPATGGGTGFQVFGPDGMPIARATMPEGAGRSTSLVIRGQHVYAIVPDTMEIPRVVRYRVERSMR